MFTFILNTLLSYRYRVGDRFEDADEVIVITGFHWGFCANGFWCRWAEYEIEGFDGFFKSSVRADRLRTDYVKLEEKV